MIIKMISQMEMYMDYMVIEDTAKFFKLIYNFINCVEKRYQKKFRNVCKTLVTNKKYLFFH